MNIFHSAVPFLIFIMYSLYVRKKILIVLGIPIIMSMRESAFIQTIGYSLKLPFLPFTFNWTFLVLFLLFVFAFYFLKNTAMINHKKTKRIQMLLLCYIFLVLLQVAVPFFLSGVGNFGIIISMIVRASFPIYVLIWIYIFKRISHESADKLIKAIVFITFFQSIMYILNGMGFNIYPSSIYLETQFEGIRIIRDFKTIPVYIFIALPILMVSHSLKDKYYLIVTLVAVVMTYTRSVIIAVGVSFIAHLVFFFNKTIFDKKFILMSIVIGYSIVLLLISFGGYMGGYSRYIGDRFEQVNETGYEESSLGSRSETFLYVIERNTLILNLFGNGFNLGGAIDRYEDAQTSLTADSTWTQLLYYSGIFGGVLVASIYLILFLKVFLISKQRKRFSLIELGMFLSVLYYASLSFTSSVAISLPAAFSIAYIAVYIGVD